MVGHELTLCKGGMMNIRWVAKAVSALFLTPPYFCLPLTGSTQGVFEGHFCTAQGVMKQVGDVGVALWYDLLSWLIPCHLLISLARWSAFV